MSASPPFNCVSRAVRRSEPSAAGGKQATSIRFAISLALAKLSLAPSIMSCHSFSKPSVFWNQNLNFHPLRGARSFGVQTQFEPSEARFKDYPLLQTAQVFDLSSLSLKFWRSFHLFIIDYPYSHESPISQSPLDGISSQNTAEGRVVSKKEVQIFCRE